VGHDRCGAALGHPTDQGLAGTLGKAVGDRSPVCTVFQRRGSPHRGSAAATASSLRASTAYLYRDEEVTALIEAAACLPSPTGLRAATYATLLGLLAVTGCASANRSGWIAPMWI